MEHIYHAQREVTSFYNRIPRVPEEFPAEPSLLSGLTEGEFRLAFARFAGLMKRMYRDMEVRPEAYGLLLDRIEEKVTGRSDHGPANRAGWRSVKRLGDVIAALGGLGEPEGDALRVPLAGFRDAVKKLNKAHLLLDRLIDHGCVIAGYAGGKYEKGAEALRLSFPDCPGLPAALRAYVRAPDFYDDDPHQFYYFDYKRVADRGRLSPRAVAEDMAALLPGDRGRLLTALYD